VFAVKVDDRETRKAFKKLTERQIPFATANALNILANDVRQDLVSEMQKVFDRPTPFTLKAFYVLKASPRRLTARVEIRDSAPKGTPAWKYLQPQMEGGPRRMKRLERRLSALSGGQFIVPGRGAKLDQYGNISRGQIQQVLSRLGAQNDPQQNMTDKTQRRLAKKGLIAKGARSDYFIAKSKTGNKRPLGVYQLVAPGQVEPILVFTPKAPTYRKRFDPDKVVLVGLNKYGASALQRAIAHELATAK
jgi:hypothetical protein